MKSVALRNQVLDQWCESAAGRRGLEKKLSRCAARSLPHDPTSVDGHAFGPEIG